MKRGVKEIILKLLKERPEWHPTASAIYDELKKVMPGLAFSSVYRALSALIEEKKIRGFTTYYDDERRYETYKTPHPHFKCIECGKIYDIDFELNKAFKGLVEIHTGHIVREVHVTYYGICKECFNKKVKDLLSYEEDG